MDRRSFLRSAGMSAAGAAFAATNSFAEAPAPGESPQFLSGSGRDRSQIQSNDLTPWTPSAAQPWDVHTINHLYRRAGFGATLAEIATAKGQNYSDVVDALLNDAFLTQPTVPPLPSYADDGKTPSQPPAWLNVPPYVYNNAITQMTDYQNANMKIRSHWAVQMNQPGTMLREKLVLFWMNHFVVEVKKTYFPQTAYSYLTYFRNNAWGNFKQMVSDVTITPAMLTYLDGILNTGVNPNENYARELQELFTMGVYYKNDLKQPNYTQYDVEAIAHSLTGWYVDLSSPFPYILPAKYEVNNHDSSFQKIYDDTLASYNLKAAEKFGVMVDADLIEHMFDKRGDQIAWFICSKLYQYFVYHDISGTSELAVIDAMAALFKQTWEIKPVISALLKSAHFFDEANIGAEIKSPYEHLIGLLRTFDIQIDELAGGSLYYYALGGSQELLDPPNVKGWPGYHNWVSTTTLPYRQYIQTLLMSGSLPAAGADGYGSNNLPVYLQDNVVTAWGKQFANYSGTFDAIVDEIATYLCAQKPSSAALDYVKKSNVFAPNVYEWGSLDDASKITPLRQMAYLIMSLADFQLS
jgi:uncharacterized protein (DUF1800 family)